MIGDRDKQYYWSEFIAHFSGEIQICTLVQGHRKKNMRDFGLE